MPVALALIETVVDEALKLPPQRRKAHLTERLESEEDRRTAENRLALMEGAMSFLVTAGWAAEDAGTLQDGDRLGAWAVEQFLGSGGMGEVYRARRADGHYDQTAAIKLTRVEADDEHRQFARRVRPDEPVDQRPDPALEPFLRRGVIGNPAMGRVLDGFSLQRDPPDLCVQLKLGMEVVVDRGNIDLGLLADCRDRCARIAPAAEHLDRGVEDPPLGVVL